MRTELGKGSAKPRKFVALGDVMFDIIQCLAESPADPDQRIDRIGGTAVNFARAACEAGYEVLVVAPVPGGVPTLEDLHAEVPTASWHIERLVGAPRVSHFTLRGGLRIACKTTGNNAVFSREFLRKLADEMVDLREVEAIWVSGYVAASARHVLDEVLELFRLAKMRGIRVILDVAPHDFTAAVGQAEAQALLALTECVIVSVDTVKGLQKGDARSDGLNRVLQTTHEALQAARSWLRLRVPSGVVHSGLNGIEWHYWWSVESEGELRLDPRKVTLGEPGVGDKVLIQLLPSLFPEPIAPRSGSQYWAGPHITP